LDELAARGLFGLSVPERFGGAGLSLAAATRVISELAEHNGSVGTCVGLHSGLALHALLHHATPSAQARYLPEVARGRRIAAFAATEPGAGSDISSVRTTLSESGGRLWLDGAKSYVTNGGLCGLLTVLARSPGLGGARAGHTLVLVDPASPGVARGREESKLGLKGSSTLTLTFDAVEVPRDHVLGEVSKGLELAHAALCWGRTYLSAGCLGTARAALAQATAHTGEREQFGRSLSQFPLVRDSLAQGRARVFAVESVLRLVCALADGRVEHPLVASSILKVLASESAWSVTDRALQLMGAAGYLEDSGMARRFRDVRVTRIFEGANDVLRLSLAATALGWQAERLSAHSAEATAAPRLLPEARAWDRAFGDLVAALRTLKKACGYRLFEQQAVAAALADAIISVFGALAVLERAGAERACDLELARLALAIQLDESAASLGRLTQR
jgi:alkylation response protein AidB-like acyl-CoA dehydrogenase